MEHADIVDVGVVGVYEPSREYQLVRAYVVKHASATVSEADVTAWMQRESAATAHLTGGVVFVEELPRNSVSCPVLAVTSWPICSSLSCENAMDVARSIDGRLYEILC